MGGTHSCEQVGRDAGEAKGRMGSVWSGPWSQEAGTTGQKRQVNVASCHMCGHISVLRSFLLCLSFELKRYGVGNQEAWLLDLAPLPINAWL